MWGWGAGSQCWLCRKTKVAGSDLFKFCFLICQTISQERKNDDVE